MHVSSLKVCTISICKITLSLSVHLKRLKQRLKPHHFSSSFTIIWEVVEGSATETKQRRARSMVLPISISEFVKLSWPCIVKILFSVRTINSFQLETLERSVLFSSAHRNADQFLGSGLLSATSSLTPVPRLYLVVAFRLLSWYSSQATSRRGPWDSWLVICFFFCFG